MGGMLSRGLLDAFGIQGAASTTENGPVRVSLDASTVVALNAGSTLLLGGSGVAVPSIPATAATAVHQGDPAMSFPQMLQGGLADVNLHTSTNRCGAVRGQLSQVSTVPEASPCAMWNGAGPAAPVAAGQAPHRRVAASPACHPGQAGARRAPQRAMLALVSVLVCGA